VEFKLLNPTNDTVFKMLLTRYEVLLRDVIEAVLDRGNIFGSNCPRDRA
jgi:hypothetical protein